MSKDAPNPPGSAPQEPSTPQESQQIQAQGSQLQSYPPPPPPPPPPSQSAYPQQFQQSQVPPPKKSKALLITVIVIAAIVLLCGATLCAVAMGYLLANVEPITETPAPLESVDPPKRELPDPAPPENETPDDEDSDDENRTDSTKKVGDNENGYVEVPEDWITFYDEDAPGSTQYCNSTGTQIVTLRTYGTSTEYDPKTMASAIYAKFEAENYLGIESAIAYDIQDYTAYKVYGIEPNSRTLIIIWFFEDENGIAHFLSIEGPISDTPKEVFYIPETFTLK